MSDAYIVDSDGDSVPFYSYWYSTNEADYTYGRYFYLPNEISKLSYSFTEYNQDLYYVPFQFQYDLLEFCKLTDTPREFVYKYNQTVLFSYRYIKIAKESEIDGLVTYEIPFRYLDTDKTLVSEFGENSYKTDTIIQYYPDDSYMDIGISDMDAIELYRQDVFSQYADAGNTIFGDGTESDLIAICPVYDEPYSLITNVEIREIN